MDNRRPNGKDVTVQAKALHNFLASASDELTFNAGDDLDIHSAVPENGWLSAYNRRSRQSGLVPSTYIDVQQNRPKPNFYNTTIIAADTSTDVSQEISLQSHTDSTISQSELQSSIELGIVIEDNYGIDSELLVSKGQIVEVLQEPIDGWVWVRDRTTRQEGYIPCAKLNRNYKKDKILISDALRDALSQQSAHTRLSPELDPPGASCISNQNEEGGISEDDQGIVVTALWDYISRGNGELTVNASEELIVLEKGETWTYTKSKLSGESGYVPTAYLQVMIGDVTDGTTDDLSVQDEANTSSHQALKGTARLKCAKGNKNEGDEVELIDTSNLNYLLVRCRISKEQFYVKTEELDFTSFNHNTEPTSITNQGRASPISPPILRSSNPSQMGASSTIPSRPLPSLPIRHDKSSNQTLKGMSRLETAGDLNTVPPTLPPIMRSHSPLQTGSGSRKAFRPLPSPPIPQEMPSNKGIEVMARLRVTRDLSTVPPILPPNARSPSPSQNNGSVTDAFRPLPSLPIPQGAKPKVPLKPGTANGPAHRMRIPPPLPPHRQADSQPPVNGENNIQGSIMNIPPPLPPQRKVNSGQPVNEENNIRGNKMNTPPSLPPQIKVNSIRLMNEKSLKDKEYYMESIDRSAIKALLFGPGTKEGTFIVRKSATADNEFAISVRYLETVKHYRIKHDAGGMFYVNDGEIFQDVVSLVQHYQSNEGLQHKLVAPYAWVKNKYSLTMDPWEIDPHCITMICQLGAGNFGTVNKANWKAVDKDEPVVVAVKTFKEDIECMREEFIKETESMKKLRHPNLVRMFGICSEGQVMIVMEFVMHGDLKKFLKLGPGSSFKEPALNEICRQVANGMVYLESQCYIHRDLAARNILVADGNKYKIADFGLARITHDDIYAVSGNVPLPYKWTAPEVHLHDTYSHKSDVWAYGVLQWEIFSYGENPYTGLTNSKSVNDFLKSGHRMAKPSLCSEQHYKMVMLPCWNDDPNSRPSFTDIQGLLEQVKHGNVSNRRSPFTYLSRK